MIKSGSVAHRYTALGLLLLLLSLLSMAVMSVVAQADEAESSYASQLLRMQKYQALVKREDFVLERQQQLTAQLSADTRFLAQTTVSLAQADLQKRLQRSIQSSGASLVSMQSVDRDMDAGFVPVTMRLHLKLNHRALSDLLYQLEHQQPTGFIDELQIQRSVRSIRQTGSSDPQLDVRLMYSIYMVAADAV